MKLTIKKSDGTKLIKEFKKEDVGSAKALGWEEIGAKPKKKKSKKSAK
tara:strand:- start:143 stop:286 length:144 start_codon:yes stop_codon:yes gene_type:complete